MDHKKIPRKRDFFVGRDNAIFQFVELLDGVGEWPKRGVWG